MKSYLTHTPDFQHDQVQPTGLLLTNLGTPDAPTPAALRRYLSEFLRDPRITELPRWLWWPILYGVILNVRPRRSAKSYASVWTEQGSPLLSISQAQQKALAEAVTEQFSAPFKVVLGMRYGNPSIASALEQLRAANVQRLLVLPLYPQYSSATTGSTFDALSDALKKWRWLPELRFITHYHDQPDYIQALADQIQAHWTTAGQPDKLLFSYHGIPKRFFTSGDPYHCECHKTSRLVAECLGLTTDQWLMTFQSRFGREEWLRPYTDETLKILGQTGVKKVDVICPGFSADCLETLEEIAEENRHYFLDAGGETFHYIPALNDQPAHIQALLKLVEQHTQGWTACTQPPDALQAAADLTQQQYTQYQLHTAIANQTPGDYS